MAVILPRPRAAFGLSVGMLRAIIFDCDGVIADTEPLHLAVFQKVLGEEAITLTAEEYYRHYLALDDRGCFSKVLASHGKLITDEKLSELIRRKAHHLEPVIRSQLRVFPGVVDFIQRAADAYPLAVASGALRHEVELILEHVGVRHCFQAIVAAEDVSLSKPHPQPFLKAQALLSGASVTRLEPHECLVIEDSIHGIDGAHLAGMRCLAVTNSYPREKLGRAERIVDSLEGISLHELEAVLLQ